MHASICFYWFISIEAINATNYTNHILMNTTQKAFNVLIYTISILLASSLGALLMFLVIDV